MSPIPHLVGMIHLGPLPGSPRFEGSIDHLIDMAVGDARLLKDAGFPALIIENFGDDPFFPDQVQPETVAAMTLGLSAVTAETGLPVGVNVLRNDALAAMGIAAVTGAPLIRVNILTGIMYTDQGPITGKAAEVARKRAALGVDVEVWADVMVKHATPPPGFDLGRAAIDTIERGGADALIISGSGTGSSPDVERLATVRSAVGSEVRIAVGSGVSPENMADLAEYADTMIVGSYTKVDGSATKPVDPARASKVVDRARDLGIG